MNEEIIVDNTKEVINVMQELDKPFLHYNITAHAYERYAERIAKQENFTDIKSYVNNHRDDIKERIEKLINYGELIYTGTRKEYGLTKVFLKDRWVVLVGSNDNVVTLYRIDFGDDEVSDLFVNKRLKNLEEANNKVEEAKARVADSKNQLLEQKTSYEETITSYESLIRQYRQLIESTNVMLKTLDVEVREQEQKVTDIIDALIGKKFF